MDGDLDASLLSIIFCAEKQTQRCAERQHTMPIAALPPSTAQAIGSTSVLSDPCAVVKELLDNGLDATATSISVEISQNTIDTIQVKDNGHGIAPDDFEYVCKRAYTSKIQTLDDLRNVGGHSLGFRGEALASAAEMADTLTVTTRTNAEFVGSVLKYDRKGDLVSTGKTSHPVGTTVCVTGFLKNIPVRRQTTVKNAAKTIIKIKKLLQAYAIARPCTRISFKVLKSKSEKDNWMYAPALNADIGDAARKVVGVEVASQCFCKPWPDKSDHDADESVSLVAFLPKSDADFAKVGGSGQYLSVDGRPLSSPRGTPKDIVQLFKSYIRSASKASGHTTVSDPFLCLQITCPKGSYDANVEPSKDDVLFAEREGLVTLTESLFKEVYGELDKESETVNESFAPLNDFNLLLRRPVMQPPISSPATNPRVSGSRDIPWTTVTPQRSVPLLSQERAGSSETESGMTEPESSNMNPWTIAKTHFIHRSSDSNRTSRLFTPIRHDQQRHSKETRAENTQSSPSTVPSPDSHASSPEQRRGSRSSSTSESVENRERLHVYTKGSRERDRERYGNGSLDTWFTKQNQPVLTSTSRPEQFDQDGTESVMLDDLDTDDVFEPPSKIINKPFKLPLSPRGRSSQAPELFSRQLSAPDEASSDIERHERRQEFPVMEEWSSRLHQPSPDLSQSQISDSQETELALDFERRKREATIARREQLQNGQLSLTPASSQLKSPHQNRYLAARAALSASTQKQGQIDLLPSGNDHSLNSEKRLADSDPRAYLMRINAELEETRSSSGAPRKPKRAFTNRLPFEKIPDGCDNHNLALHLCLPSAQSLSKECRSITAVDTYASSGKEIGSFALSEDPDLAEICKTWEDKISRLVKEKYRLRDVDLYGAEGGSDEAHLRDVDIYAAIQASSFSNI